jgi:hypothetical protein
MISGGGRLADIGHWCDWRFGDFVVTAIAARGDKCDGRYKGYFVCFQVVYALTYYRI